MKVEGEVGTRVVLGAESKTGSDVESGAGSGVASGVGPGINSSSRLVPRCPAAL